MAKVVEGGILPTGNRRASVNVGVTTQGSAGRQLLGRRILATLGTIFVIVLAVIPMDGSNMAGATQGHLLTASSA
jgi:hypothetical protein